MLDLTKKELIDLAGFIGMAELELRGLFSGSGIDYDEDLDSIIKKIDDELKERYNYNLNSYIDPTTNKRTVDVTFIGNIPEYVEKALKDRYQ